MTTDITIDLERLEEIFRDYIKRVPTSLALRSTMRMVGLSKHIKAGETVLDVGCGDGCFGQLFPAEASLIIDGIDLCEDEARLARATGAYRDVQVGDISQAAPEGAYDVALGNCSLEHVPDIHQAFANIYRALKPGGRLLLSVPAFGWSRTMGPVRSLEKVSNRLAMAAAGALDGFFQHHHLYGERTWRLVVEGSGFEVTSAEGLGGPQINRLFERGLPPAFLEFVFKSIFRRYVGILSPLRRMPSEAVLEEITNQPISLDSRHLIEYVLEARKPR